MSTEVTLTGRLGQDPELRFTPSGKAVCKLSVVTSRRIKDGDEWKDADTTWWNVSVWDQLAERCAEHLTKGQAVILQGRANTRSYETNDGTKGISLDVTAFNVGLDLRWNEPGAGTTRTRSAPQQSSMPSEASGTTDDPGPPPTRAHPPKAVPHGDRREGTPLRLALRDAEAALDQHLDDLFGDLQRICQKREISLQQLHDSLERNGWSEITDQFWNWIMEDVDG